jgi:hypothetical protein
LLLVEVLSLTFKIDGEFGAEVEIETEFDREPSDSP